MNVRTIAAWVLFPAMAAIGLTACGGSTSSDPSALAHALAQGGGAANTPPALPSPPIPGFPGSSAPLLPQSPGAAPDSSSSSARVAALEAQLAAQSNRLEDLRSTNDQLARQNERDKAVIGRYREQWEKLKAGARRKEVERRERRERVASESGGDVVGEVATGARGRRGLRRRRTLGGRRWMG